MRWRDGEGYFGWISIGLHWLGATIVVTLLFIGNSINATQVIHDSYLRLHTSIGLTASVALMIRVAWRFINRHPTRLPRQKAIYYAIGKPFHYLLLIAIIVMLISGPLMAWAGGLPLRLWDLTIPSPYGVNASLFAALRQTHLVASSILGWGTLLHILAVLKHTAFDRDGSFDRMLMPVAPKAPPVGNTSEPPG